MLLLALATAHADTWAPWSADFVLEPRDDAPVDAVLMYEANYVPEVSVTDGPGAPMNLIAEIVVPQTSGNRPLVAVAAPTGGWEPGATYTVTAERDKGESDPPASFTFTVGSDTAASPRTPVVTSVSATEWSEETEYEWGCCHPTRTVTVSAQSDADDPWAYVLLRGAFTEESQLTTEPSLSQLDAAFGPGTHQLEYQQWSDGAIVWPSAFEVVHVAANGVWSESVPVELENDLPISDTGGGGEPKGCSHSGGATGGFLGALGLLLFRRERPAK